MAKTHTIIVRNVPKEIKHSLKRQAKAKRQSVNSFLLAAIDLITCVEISDYKKVQKQLKEKFSMELK